MDDHLPKTAIHAALSGDWKEAEKINRQILKFTPKDTDALNRLARALAEQGKIKKAIQIAKRSLKLDPLNTIAKKNLTRWRLNTKTYQFKTITKPLLFLEEPGKTKTIELINLGDPKLLAQLDCGDEVNLAAYTHRVSITTPNGVYIGRLPDDLSSRLIMLVNGGNTYQVCIKSISNDEVVVFLKEITRSEKFQYIASFPI